MASRNFNTINWMAVKEKWQNKRWANRNSIRIIHRLCGLVTWRRTKNRFKDDKPTIGKLFSLRINALSQRSNWIGNYRWTNMATVYSSLGKILSMREESDGIQYSAFFVHIHLLLHTLPGRFNAMKTNEHTSKYVWIFLSVTWRSTVAVAHKRTSQ